MNFKLTFALLLFCLSILMGTTSAGCGTAPTGVIGCYPVNIVNTNSVATSSGFQQMLSALPFNALQGNYLVYNGLSGTTLAAWTENAGVQWLNLGANTIAASSSANGIYYIGVGAPGTNFFIAGNNIGEAPQLSATYNAYNNGATVFNFFEAFSGNTLSGAWSSFTGTGDVTVANSLSVSGGNGWRYSQNTNSITLPYVEETMVKEDSTGDPYAGIGNSGISGAAPGLFVGTAGYSANQFWMVTNAGGADQWGISAANTWYLLSGYASASSVRMTVNYTKQIETQAYAGSSGNIRIVLNPFGGTAVYQWIRVRTAPPSNVVMPTVTYGAYQAVGGGGAAISLTIASNPVNYGATDVLTASGNTVNTITLGYCVGSGVCGSPISLASGTGSATNTICDTAPSMANCWAAGTYNVVAKDVGASATDAIILTINKAAAANTLTTCSDQPYTTSYSCTTSASITTLGNQVIATLQRNGAAIGTSNSAIADTIANSIGNFAYTWAASSTANYSAFTATQSFNGYVPFSLLNLTAGTSTENTKQLSPANSPFTWNTYYPIKVYATSPSNTISYTLLQNGGLLQSNVLNPSYQPPSNIPTGNYLFTMGEFQAANVIYLSVNTNSLIMNTILTTPACPAPILYFPNTCNAPTWSVTPASWTIQSDVPGNQHANVLSTDTWSNANQIFLPSYLLSYNNFNQFAANQLNNPQIATITQNAYCSAGTSIFQASASAPGAPCTREIMSISTFDQRTYNTLSAGTTTLLGALFNNYTFSNQTTLTANAFGIYMPTATVNPPITITSLTLSSQANGHFLALNNYCPLTLNSPSYMTLKPYLVDLNGSLYTLNIYAGYGIGGSGDYMWVMDGVSNVSAVNVQQYKISSSPFAMALENGASYAFRFYNSQCKFITATNYSIWSNPININLPQNTTVPNIKTTNAIASCTKTPTAGNTMTVTCTGTDTQNLVTNWNIQYYNISTISGWTIFNSINATTASFSQSYPGLSNVSALQVRVTATGAGFAVPYTFEFNQGSVLGGVGLAGRVFLCIVMLLVGLGLGVAGANAGAIDAQHAPSTTCIIEAFMLAIMLITGISSFIPIYLQVILIVVLIYVAVMAHRAESTG